jgi:hypothetical protein
LITIEHHKNVGGTHVLYTGSPKVNITPRSDFASGQGEHRQMYTDPASQAPGRVLKNTFHQIGHKALEIFGTLAVLPAAS